MKGTSVRPTAMRAAGALTAAVLLAACSNDGSTVAGPRPPSLRTPSFAIMPTWNQALAPSLVGGAQFYSYNANESLRTNANPLEAEFWDNVSGDQASIKLENPNTNTAPTGCNVGQWATGAPTLEANCQSNAAGSTENGLANTTSSYPEFLGGASRNVAPPILFDGDYNYELRLLASYEEGDNRSVGIFFKKADGTYEFRRIDALVSRTVNSTFIVTPALTGGRDWGFYVANDFGTTPSGCGPLDALRTHCSDFGGSWNTGAGQHFALFINRARTSFLVGIEDNKLELNALNDGPDSDYNDFIISVTPQRTGGEGGFGCSPGFWKNTRDFNWAATGYSPNQSFASVFGEDPFNGASLRDVLGAGGGGINALGRHTVAALLNASAISQFELTRQEVISKFQQAYPGSNAAYNTLKNEFEALIDVNGRVCPLNNGSGGRS